MDVRLARPTDAPLVLALALDDKAHLVRSNSWPAANPVARSVVRALLPYTLPGRSWLARDGSAAALLEAQPRRYVIGWDVTRLAVHGCPDAVVDGVVAAATAHLRAHGVPRLFARCAPEASDLLKARAFHPLAREYVLARAPMSPERDGELPIDSRYRMPQDAWPLHQLESDVTPPLVRQLEGLTSLDWSRMPRGRSEIVVERDGRVVAWIGWGSAAGRGITHIDLLVHREHAEAAASLVDHVLATAPEGTLFAARVRDYHTEALTILRNAGFEIVGEEVLLVKHGSVELAKVKLWWKVTPAPSVHAFHNQMSRPAARKP